MTRTKKIAWTLTALVVTAGIGILPWYLRRAPAPAQPALVAEKVLRSNPGILSEKEKERFKREGVVPASVRKDAETLANTAKAQPTLHTSLLNLDLSRPPTEKELIMAGQLGDPLSPTRSADAAQLKDPKAAAMQEADNWAFGKAIQQWNEHHYDVAVGMFRQHLKDFPDSPWVAESELHIGCASQYTGQFDQCLECFTHILDYAPKDSGVYFKSLIRIGNIRTLQGKLKDATEAYTSVMATDTEARRRTYASSWIQLLTLYRQQKVALRDCVQKSVREICAVLGKPVDLEQIAVAPAPQEDGFSATETVDFCTERGFSPRAVRSFSRLPQEFAGPWLAHYSDQHFVAVFGVSEKDLDIFDTRVGFRRSISRESFLNQWSGVAIELGEKKSTSGSLAMLSNVEMDEVVGGCCGVARAAGHNGKPGGSLCASGSGEAKGSPEWWVNPVTMNMVVTDTPMWWHSPYGMDVNFTMTFNSLDSLNAVRPFGDKWVLNYCSYLMEDPSGKVTIVGGNGRQRVFMPATGGAYTPEVQFEYTLAKTGTYDFTAQDSDTEMSYYYGRPSGVSTSASLLTSIVDKWGVTVTLGYNSSGAVTSVTHSLGGTWDIYYNSNSQIDHIDDPFSRTATFSYDSSYALREVTDMGDQQYSYRYSNSANPVNATPSSEMLMTEIILAPQELVNEGQPNRTWHPLTWQFYTQPADGNPSAMWENYAITVTHPGFGKEYYYFDGVDGTGRHKDRQQMLNNTTGTSYSFTVAGGIGNVSTINPAGGGSVSLSSYNSAGVPLGLTDRLGNANTITVNSRQRPLTLTDSSSRVTTMQYESNGFDIKKVITPDTVTDVEISRNSQRLPQEITHRDGTKTALTWNSHGQPVTIVQKDSTGTTVHTTTYTYSGTHYRLTSVDVDGRTMMTLTYDAVGRVATVTEEEGITLTFTCDDLDRIVTTEFPDGTSEQTSFLPLSGMVDHQISRDGQTTRNFFDASGFLMGVRASGQRFIYFGRNADGDVTELVDSAGNSIYWTYDTEHRVTSEKRADGTNTTFSYNTKGQLMEQINSRGLKTTVTYDTLGRLSSKAFLNGGTTAFPSESFTYDTLDRIETSTDGEGTTTLTYNTLGQLTSVNGPWSNDTFACAWDVQGRLDTVTYPGGETQAVTYDSDGRVSSSSGPFGTTALTYVGRTSRPSSVSQAGGLLTTAFSWTGTSDLLKLEEIHNEWHIGSAATLSKFTLSWNPQEDLSSLTRELGTGSGSQSRWDFGSDSAHQLVSAKLSSLPGGTLVNETRWGYDAMGNRIWEQTGASGNRREWGVNALNQLTSQSTYSSSPRPWVEGTVSEPGSVTLGGLPANVKGDLTFSGQAPASQSVIKATDRAGNVTSETWQFVSGGSSGSSQSFSFDNGGNMLGDGTSTFEWDLRNRLTAIITGTHRTEFSYDGEDHRVRVIEKDSGTVTSDHRYVWSGSDLYEERDTSSGTVLRRFYGEGHIDVAGGGTRYVYTRDHLDSVREVMELSGISGNPTSGTLVAQYDYTPWGERSVVVGGSTADNLVMHGFTGHVRHPQGGLWIAPYRTFSPSIARWLSQDPIGLNGGLNQYRYVENAPTTASDPLGLISVREYVQDWANVAAAFGDTITFDTTKKIREAWGIDGGVDSCSGYYKIGAFGGKVWQQVSLFVIGGYVFKGVGFLAQRGATMVTSRFATARFGANLPKYLEANNVSAAATSGANNVNVYYVSGALRRMAAKFAKATGGNIITIIPKANPMAASVAAASNASGPVTVLMSSTRMFYRSIFGAEFRALASNPNVPSVTFILINRTGKIVKTLVQEFVR